MQVAERPVVDAPCVKRTAELYERLAACRLGSLALAEPLSAEDMVVQPMDDASPTKWHLAHTTWFFETFVLLPHLAGYELFDETFSYCFNSYYESIGKRQPRDRRGVLTRPSISRVFDYRAHVDEALSCLSASSSADDPDVLTLVDIGINHEQQHQELLLTDILALFAANPLLPAYRQAARPSQVCAADPTDWLDHAGGLFEIGAGKTGFRWDNEQPRHTALVHPFRLARRLVTNAEWLGFIDDGGYETPALWLSDGWAQVKRDAWPAPLYWQPADPGWAEMTLEGLMALDPAAPVRHVSYYEADAFARWAGHRLPTEFEWEVAANAYGTQLDQLFGHVWQWTSSAYAPYPGYRPAAGAIGEYNGKFMVSQQVLRGSSAATPQGHSRSTYRNFFYPHQRWQFTGLRLASEAR